MSRQRLCQNAATQLKPIHTTFDAFSLKNDKPDPSRKGNGNFKRNIGGVPLGLKIAEDIFAAGEVKHHANRAARACRGSRALQFE